MKRSTLATLGVALLCCFALAFAAAALPNPQPTSGTAENASDDGSGVVHSSNPFERVDADFSAPAWLTQLLAAAVVVGFVLGFVVFFERPLETAKRAAIVVVPVALIALLVYALSLLSGDPGGGGESVGVPTTATGSDGTEPVPVGFDPALLGVAAVVAVLVVALLVRYLGAGGGALDALAGDEEDEADDGAPAEVGNIAGRAADRIEGSASAVDNEVYRAWREMTTHLDVDAPASSTPAEFADAAVAAGVDEADATELTELFRAVRYGGEEPTPEREERAVAVLRRIEAGYGDEPAP